MLDLLDVDQLLDPHDLTSDRLRDGVVFGRHALAQAERLQHALRLDGHTDARAHESYAEVRHFVRVVCVLEGLDVSRVVMRGGMSRGGVAARNAEEVSA
jgi:hypothetical protein